MQNMNRVLENDPLGRLIQEENFIGWVYSIDYDTVLVMTNDLWKFRALGVPHNSFLLAATFNPREFSSVVSEEKEAILLRVVGSTKLPQDDDSIRTKIDYYQQQIGIHPIGEERDYDDLTRGQMQFGGLTCRILGTFYLQEGELKLGSDLESFTTAARLGVYRPRKGALKAIVNYIDPVRRKKAVEDAAQLGIKKSIPSFRIGTVRYTSTDRLHRQNPEELVEVSIQPSDFLAHRTAVLGMTRTGKSNMVKQTIAVVKRVADESEVPIGQIIYDINGEYANANNIDEGSLADVYEDETIRYRMLKTSGFEELQNNFYLQINEGITIIRQIVKDSANSSAADIQTFLDMPFDEPDQNDHDIYNRWQVRVAAYKALLYKADFPAPEDHPVIFRVNGEVHRQVGEKAGRTFPDPQNGLLRLTLDEALDWFTAARAANGRDNLLKSSGGGPWLDNNTKAILNMIACKNEKDTYFNGYKVLSGAKKFHSARRKREVGKEIYEHLKNGKIVILDLSVGNPTLRERISEQIARYIFEESMNIFIQGRTPPNIVVYIEEAHNLIGKGMKLHETWPRLAKEGAKYRIALVYATQEVSSVHPNILSNTENWFITHLNNSNEIKELARFYDFEDFSRSLIHVQDVGFARVKTLSGPFVIPVQIDQFKPGIEKGRSAEVRRRREASGKKKNQQAGPGLFESLPEAAVVEKED
jgi:hypothetical protein